jgi:hypothetical protein
LLQLLVPVFACVAPETALSGPSPDPPSEPDSGEPIEHVRPYLGAPSDRPWPEVAESEDLGDGDRLYADATIHELHLTLSDDARASLALSPSAEVSAGLRWRHDDLRVALRLKGSSSFRTIDQKPSFKIDVHDADPTQRIDGEKRLTLNNMIQDPTMQREHAYYWLAHRLGVPAPRIAYARVFVNDAEYGLYSLVETMDEELIERAFDGDEEGNLYESSGADLTYARDWFTLEESGGVLATPDDIEDLVDAAERTRDGGFWDMLQDHFDMPATLTYWALDIAAGNDDGYAFNHHNYLLYHAPVADRWSFLPWGTDRSFTRQVPPTGDLVTPLAGDLVIRCWEDDTCSDALTTRLREVLDLWDADLPDRLEEDAALIEGACDDDPRKELPCDPGDLADFVDARSAYLRSQLEGPS